MGYRVKTGRPIEHRGLQQLDAVRCALREREGALALAMTFDPGDEADATLTVHAMDIMLGLMHLRGWRKDGQEMLIGMANGWPDEWWEATLGTHAFVVESDLIASPGSNPDDINRIIALTQVAWCMERELRTHHRPIPDLMTAFEPGGAVLANIYPEPLRDAMRAQRPSIVERMEQLPEHQRSLTSTHVLLHLEGSEVRPWCLDGAVCTFGTASTEEADKRVFIALEETGDEPDAHTTRALLRLMLANETGD